MAGRSGVASASRDFKCLRHVDRPGWCANDRRPTRSGGADSDFTTAPAGLSMEGRRRGEGVGARRAGGRGASAPRLAAGNGDRPALLPACSPPSVEPSLALVRRQNRPALTDHPSTPDGRAGAVAQDPPYHSNFGQICRRPPPARSWLYRGDRSLGYPIGWETSGSRARLIAANPPGRRTERLTQRPSRRPLPRHEDIPS